MSKGAIVLDADGVLLDYNRAYAKVWAQVFGSFPHEKNPMPIGPLIVGTLIVLKANH